MGTDRKSVGRIGGRRALRASVSAAAVWSAAALVAAVLPATVLAAPPAKDSFTGTITGTGAFSGDHGTVSIVLTPGPGQATRHLTVTIKGSRCAARAHCVQLSGRLVGTLTAGPRQVPDVGQSFTIRATGTVKPLGHVAATGTVHGTGFIAHGHESLRLRLARAGGSVTIDGVSGLVPGFTSP